MNNPSPSLLTVRAALLQFFEAFDGIAVTTKLDVAKSFFVYRQAMESSDDTDYPKIILPLDGGKLTDLPNRQTVNKVTFDGIFVFKQVPIDPYNVHVSVQVLQFVDDFMFLKMRNWRLNDTVESFDLLDWTTDSGFTHPEGCVVMQLGVTFKRDYRGV